MQYTGNLMGERMCVRLVDKKNLRRYDDCLSYTLVSSKKALKQAGLEKEVSDVTDFL